VNAPLVAINQRWRETNHPHAVQFQDRWGFYCPRCETEGEASCDTLHGAMNNALLHKGQCPALS